MKMGVKKIKKIRKDDFKVIGKVPVSMKTYLRLKDYALRNNVAYTDLAGDCLDTHYSKYLEKLRNGDDLKDES
jgi:hypothetical protein